MGFLSLAALDFPRYCTMAAVMQLDISLYIFDLPFASPAGPLCAPLPCSLCSAVLMPPALLAAVILCVQCPGYVIGKMPFEPREEGGGVGGGGAHNSPFIASEWLLFFRLLFAVSLTLTPPPPTLSLSLYIYIIQTRCNRWGWRGQRNAQVDTATGYRELIISWIGF